VFRRSAAYLTGRPRRSRILESLEHRYFLAVALGHEMPIQPPAAPFALWAEAAPVGRPSTDGTIGQRAEVVPIEHPDNPGSAGERADDATIALRADVGPGNSFFNARPNLAIQHDLLIGDMSRGTVYEVGALTEIPAFAPGFSSSPDLRSPSGLSPTRLAEILDENAPNSNGADVQSELGGDAETSFVVQIAARDGVFARFGADGGLHSDFAGMAPRQDLVLEFESRIQPPSVQATGAIQRANQDGNPHDPDAHYGGGAFATSSAASSSSMTKTGLAGIAGEILRSSPVSTPLDASDPAGNRNGPTLDRAFFAAATDYLLAPPIVARGALLLADALPDIDAAWQWSSALPLAPRLSIDAEKLGQALEAVLADIDEMSESITGSLTDGNRVYWSLAAGGVACYVVGRRFQSDAAASLRAASSRAQRGERLPARRLFHGWLPNRYPNVR